MKRKTCKILTFFVLIMLIINIQLEICAVESYKEVEGITEVGSKFHIVWAKADYSKKLNIDVLTWNGLQENYKNANYFDGKDCEIEYINYSGNIYMNEEIYISFLVKRGKHSEAGKTFVPQVKYNTSEIERDKSVELKQNPEFDNINSFEIHLKLTPKKEGDIVVDVYADDGNKTIIRITLENVKKRNADGVFEENPGQNNEENTNKFPGVDDEQNIDYWKPTYQGNNTKFLTLTGRIIGTTQVIGSVFSVSVLVILGIKYMFASLEEKASYKQSMVLYVVGCLMVFGVVNITKIIYDIAINL